jgi:DNA-binding beta-propeller fold protein YncE
LINLRPDPQAKITEKENQIDEVSKKIDAIMKEMKTKGQLKPGGMAAPPAGKKAVRIQEPGDYLAVITPTDPVSDSGYADSIRRLSSREASESCPL